MTLAKLMEKVKTSSSQVIKEKGVGNFYWQNGYGCFSVSQSEVETVARGDVRAGAVILLGEKTMPLTWRLSAASPGVVSFGEQGNLPGSVVRASRWTGGGAPVLSRSPWTWDSEGRRLFQDNGRPGRI